MNPPGCHSPSTAPWGSATIAELPRPSMATGARRMRPPSSAARWAVASASSTETYEVQAGSAPGAAAGLMAWMPQTTAPPRRMSR